MLRADVFDIDRGRAGEAEWRASWTIKNALLLFGQTAF
jgi:hypothetical protein